MHLVPGRGVDGHFNVLRGYVAPLGARRRQGRRRLRRQLPARPALGDGPAQPVRSRRPASRVAIIDAAGLTDMRTGAVTAIGAQASRAQGRAACSATSARAAPRTGTCACSTTCSTSTRSACTRAGPESRDAFAARLSRDLGKPVVATADWESCVRGADIVVEASRLPQPEPMLRTEWIAPGAFVVPYGTMSAVELSLTDIMDKLVVDDWGQCKAGQFGSLRAHVDAGKLSDADAARGAGPDRRRPQAGPRARRRDDPALASRAVAVRHRARRGDARQGEAHGHRPAPALSRSARRSRDRSPTRGCTRSTPRRPRRGARCCEWVIARAGVDLRRASTIRAPQPLPDAVGARRSRAARSCAAIRSRDATPRPTLLAAPVPSPARVRRRAGLLDRHRRARRRAAAHARRRLRHAAWRTRRPIRNRATRRRARCSRRTRDDAARCSPRPSGRSSRRGASSRPCSRATPTPARSTATRSICCARTSPRWSRRCA